jgi:MFS family permease
VRPPTAAADTAGIRLGLRPNFGQFALLVAVNALVGGMVGQERTVLPLLATEVFGLQALSSALTFIVAFGLTKALTNFAAGALSDRYGRKAVLVAGWLVGLPVPLLLIWAPSWEWVVFANVLLGINQGLTWSTTVIMKIDLVGPARRGLAMGLNEAAGYGALALTAFASGLIAERSGLRPAPFLLGVAYVGLGLGLSAFFVRETRGHARHEAAGLVEDRPHGGLSTRQVFALTSLREPALSAASQAGLVNNLNDGLAWGCCRSTLPRPAWASPRSGPWPRSTPPSGVLASLRQARCRTASGGRASSPAGCSSRRPR